MKKRIIAFLASAALTLAIWPTAGAAESRFSDVAPNKWYAVYINALTGNSFTENIISGYSDGSFRPESQVTRGEFLKMIFEASISEGSDVPLVYPSELTGSHWAEEYYQMAAKANILISNAYGEMVNMFTNSAADLDKPIIRYEMAVILNNICTNVSMRPVATIEVAKRSAMQKEIADYWQIPYEYLNAVEQSYGRGQIKGDEYGYFNGNNSLTRAQAAKVIYLYLWEEDAKNEQPEWSYVPEPVIEPLPTPEPTPTPTPTPVPTAAPEPTPMPAVIPVDVEPAPGPEETESPERPVNEPVSETGEPEVNVPKVDEIPGGGIAVETPDLETPAAEPVPSAAPDTAASVDAGSSFAWWLRDHIDAYGKLDATAKAKIFGSEYKTSFSSATDAAPYMQDVTIPIWKMDSTGAKSSGTMTVTVHKLVADEIKAIFTEIYNDPEQFPIYGGWSVGGARFTDTLRHSWGMAIDINAYYNAEMNFKSGSQRVTCGYGWWPAGMDGSTWAGRDASAYHGSMSSENSAYSITPDGSVVRAFAKYGWGWGGNGWSNGQSFDFMHFSVLPSGG